MGRVFLGELIEPTTYAGSGTRVAVKLLHPALLDDEESVRRFEREAALGATVQHPCVVRTLACGGHGTGTSIQRFLILEYVEGRNLRQVMRDLGVVPEALLRDIAVQIARGLRAVHEAGIIHRDLKPENVLLTPDHQVKIMDLGIAQAVASGTRLTGTGAFIGTLHYASPEQISGVAVGPAADLYSLGVVLYEAATGRQPFMAEGFAASLYRHLEYTPPKLGDVDPTLSPFLEEVVARLIQKEPDQRFPSAAELAVVLERGEASDWWRLRELERPAGRASAARRPATSRETEFLGRTAELALLSRLMAEAGEGAGRVVLIEGEAGIGRSRLVDEFARTLEAGPGQTMVLFGAFTPGGIGSTGGALGAALTNHFGTTTLVHRLAGLLPASPDLAAPFAALLTGTTPPAGAERLTEETTHALISDVLVSLSAQKAVLWVVEDLHFATPEGRRLIGSLARQVAGRRVLLVVTTRPDPQVEATEHLPGLEGADFIRLGRLATMDVTRLVASRGVRPSMAEELGEVLAAQADGNPYVILETLRELDRTGLLTGEGTGPGAIQPRAGSFTIPRTVRDLMLARVRGMSDSERALLDLAAVNGFEFDADLLARVLGTPRLAILQQLASLARRTGIIAAAGPGFRFDRHQLRDVLYEALPPLLRNEYHLSLAEAWQARSGPAADAGTGPGAVFLAEHYLRGGEIDKGLQCVLPALDHLGRQYQSHAQLELIELALGVRPVHRLDLESDLELRRANVLYTVGRPVEMQAAAESSRRAARALGDSARASVSGLAAGVALVAQGSYDQATATLAEAERDAGADPRLLLQIMWAQSTAAYLTGRIEEAKESYERQVALSRELDDRLAECRALDHLSNLLLALNRHEEAAEHLAREIALAREAGFRESEATALFGLGMVSLWQGNLGDASTHFTNQLALTRSLANRQATSLALVGLINYNYELGQLDEAERNITLAFDLGESAGLRLVTPYMHTYSGLVARARGDLTSAITCFEKALGLFRELKAALGIAEATFNLGRARIESGDLPAGLEALRESHGLVMQLHLSLPGPLPAAILALQGEIARGDIPLHLGKRASILAELHLLLHQLEGGEHLERAGEILRHMSRHLIPPATDLFWSDYPPARAWKAMIDSPERRG